MVDPLEHDRRDRAPTRSGSRSSTARRPGNDQKLRPGEGRERPELREQAVERHALRARRAAGDDRRRTPSGACRTRRTSARPSAGCCRVPRRRRRPWTAAMAEFNFGEVDPAPVRRDLERVLRLGHRAREGAPRRHEPPRRRPRGDLVGARRGARHLPAAAPPGDAVHHRDALEALPHRADGPGAAHRGPLAGRGAQRDPRRRREVGALVELVRAVRNARADAKLEPAAWLPLDVVRGAGAGARARGAPARARAARPGPAAAAPPHPRGPPRDGRGGGRRARRHRGTGRGDRRAPGRPTRRPRKPTGRGSRRSSRTRSGCSRRPGPAGQRGVHGEGAGRRSSRAPAPARRSSPTRSTGCATASPASPRAGPPPNVPVAGPSAAATMRRFVSGGRPEDVVPLNS